MHATMIAEGVRSLPSRARSRPAADPEHAHIYLRHYHGNPHRPASWLAPCPFHIWDHTPPPCGSIWRLDLMLAYFLGRTRIRMHRPRRPRGALCLCTSLSPLSIRAAADPIPTHAQRRHSGRPAHCHVLFHRACTYAHPVRASRTPLLACRLRRPAVPRLRLRGLSSRRPLATCSAHVSATPIATPATASAAAVPRPPNGAPLAYPRTRRF
ncbi:hypothetical protein HYPSUDRAFT_738659 [Hypholoma sublateritium FD-334 SS-4]|uniref:Uncharacterized protein n=1 Tax=Hypholoma sublateritium (strain FD-334 SS-4) TaxID=945553 RepID=A0A0D2L3E2_HYPSF|nr:hypothetical protein HYPSUDRAFT_738659 [Hypholoma sublateritium FD-334 SS-4]